ncbi:MAG: hypothetical protein HON55_04575, partial [Legionellales bacterium]|nr:hypothetical protein [Legionellales bacterium]
VKVEDTYAEGRELEPGIKKLQRNILQQELSAKMVPSQSAKGPAGAEFNYQVTGGEVRDVTRDGVVKQNMGLVMGTLHKKLDINLNVPDSIEKKVPDSSGDDTVSLSSDAASIPSDASNDAQQYDLDPKVLSRIETAIKENNSSGLKKEDLAQLFGKGNPDDVMRVAVKIHQKANGLADPSASHKGSNAKGDDKVFFALKLLLTDPNSNAGHISGYKDVRSNDWLTNLGSRKFLTGFHDGNKDRFTKVFQGKDIDGRDRGGLFIDLVEGCASTNKSGGSRLSFFGAGRPSSSDENKAMEDIKNILDGPASSGPKHGK